MLSADERRLLAAFKSRRVPFLLVGLSAAALQRAPVVTQDVDLWIPEPGSPRFLRALNDCGVSYVPPIGLNPPMLAGPGADLFDLVVRMHGLGPFAEEARHALRIRVQGLVLPVLRLDRIIASKRSLNRPKDRAVLPALEAAWRTLRAVGRPPTA
ncbi:MAG: hypothetical protein FJ221_16470 [Lentisphaerae bacterium]|nr:hypothetical protein [Lentisphaerota bacterium]